MNAEAFETHRPRLLGLAYRMLGSVASAEDLVQETWLRWTHTDDVEHPAAWLSTVCTRLCVDEARSARARRVTYVGPWLPEPWLATDGPTGMMGESLTMAFLLLLERLTPSQRAAWLLREVFDEDYGHVAAVLQTSEAACRQLVHRAREAIAAGRPRFEPDATQHAALLATFGQAVATGDVEALERLLADDVVLVGDGGGVAVAARRPVRGPQNVARFLVGTHRKLPPGARLVPAVVNGVPGVIVVADDQVYAVSVIEVAEGRVTGIRNVLNPHKLRHVTAPPA